MAKKTDTRNIRHELLVLVGWFEGRADARRDDTLAAFARLVEGACMQNADYASVRTAIASAEGIIHRMRDPEERQRARLICCVARTHDIAVRQLELWPGAQ
jgi:hypothetical protein